MKNILFILLFIPLITFGQSEPFKGANTLIVISEEENLFQLVGKQLIQDGYQIADSNSDFQTITTEWKDVRWIKYRLIVSIIDDKIQIQSKLINEAVNGVFNTQGSDWLLEWKKSGVENDAWIKMEGFASNFGTNRQYFKK